MKEMANMRMVVSTVEYNQQKTDQTAKGALPLSHKCQMLQERQKSQGYAKYKYTGTKTRIRKIHEGL